MYITLNARLNLTLSSRVHFFFFLLVKWSLWGGLFKEPIQNLFTPQNSDSSCQLSLTFLWAGKKKSWVPASFHSNTCLRYYGRHLKVYQSSSLGLPSYQAIACLTAPTLFLCLVQHELDVCISTEREASCQTLQRMAHQHMLIMLNKKPYFLSYKRGLSLHN